MGFPFGTVTHRYGTATRCCTLPWLARLCVCHLPALLIILRAKVWRMAKKTLPPSQLDNAGAAPRAKTQESRKKGRGSGESCTVFVQHRLAIASARALLNRELSSRAAAQAVLHTELLKQGEHKAGSR